MTSSSTGDQVRLIEEAQSAQLEKDWVLALARWEEILERFGADAEPWWFECRANALMHLARLDEAEQAYRRLKRE